MNDPLEALENEYKSVHEEDLDEDLDDDLDEDIEEDDDEEVEDQEDDLPEGYMTLEEWTKAGKDPDMYKGKKAYKAEYERIQKNKALERTVKDLGATLEATVAAIAEREAKAEARHRKELEAVLARAREENDVEAFEDAYEQLSELKSTKPIQSKPQMHPAIADFIETNPILEVPEINAEFARIYNGKLRADGVGPQDHISDTAIKGYAKAAMQSIKTLYPERFESPRNNRRTVAKAKAKPAQTVDIGQKIRDVKLKDAAPQNQNAANEIYEMLKEKDPKAAETFAKRMLGD